MTFLVWLIAANVVYAAIDACRDWRADRLKRLGWLRDAGEIMRKAGWVPLRLEWTGRLRSWPLLEMEKVATSERFTLRITRT